MLLRLLAGVVLCSLISVDASKEIVKQLSINFGKPLEACKQELNLPQEALQDFFNFWKEGQEFNNRETGCLIVCMAAKLDMLDDSLNLHHGKAMEFAHKHGGDEAVAKQLIDIVHNCEKTAGKTPEDPCINTLQISKCFKDEIHKLDWAPDMDLAVGELLAEG